LTTSAFIRVPAFSVVSSSNVTVHR